MKVVVSKYVSMYVYSSILHIVYNISRANIFGRFHTTIFVLNYFNTSPFAGCSSVQSPVVDFEKISQKFITDMKDKGLVVTTIARAFDGLERK